MDATWKICVQNFACRTIATTTIIIIIIIIIIILVVNAIAIDIALAINQPT